MLRDRQEPASTQTHAVNMQPRTWCLLASLSGAAAQTTVAFGTGSSSYTVSASDCTTDRCCNQSVAQHRTSRWLLD